jgi:hypothetical protein
MSNYIHETITYIQATADGFVYTSLENKIVCWKKMHKVIEFIGHKNSIIKFICFGEYIFSLAEEGEFIVFNRRDGKIVR